MSSDAYVRLGRQGARYWGQPAGPENLLFVDVVAEAPLSLMRSLPFSVLRDPSRILVRSRTGFRRSEGLFRRVPQNVRRVMLPEAGAADQESGGPSPALREVRDYVERAELDCAYGVLHQPLGKVPWVESEVEWDENFIERARAIELRSMLEWGDAIWTPADYHYLLPSGEHSPGFVRLGSAIRGPRDAEVMASWLRQHVRPGLGIVLDNGTLTPVALALQGTMRSRGVEPGSVEVLKGYPATSYDVFSALRAAQKSNAVLALLSVNSSGRVRDNLITGMQTLETAVTDQRALRVVETLISKQETSTCEETFSKVTVRTWHPMPGEPPLVSHGSDFAEACQLCRDEKRSLVVPISPDDFDGVFPASIDRLTPSISDTDRNRRLWELCDSVDAIELQVAPRAGVAARRPIGDMNIRIDLEALIDGADFRSQTALAFERELRTLEGSPAPDVILVAEDEDGSHMDELIQALRPVLGDVDPDKVVIPRANQWSDEAQRQVREANEIAILAAGAVTGATLQQLLVGAQRHRAPGEEITGLVVHARLGDERAWQTLENSYGNRLLAAYHSYLPLHSPLDDEAEVLAGVRDGQLDGLSDEAQEFFERRRRYCSDPQAESTMGLFWGTDSTSTLTPNSIFGEGLRGLAVYVAVASSMERRRQEAGSRATPTRQVFDMPAILRSYYDPMIISAVLRWLRPSERWWGESNEDAKGTVQGLMDRAQAGDRPILAAELLVAASQGKLPTSATEVARSWASKLLETDLGDLAAPLECGQALTSGS